MSTKQNNKQNVANTTATATTATTAKKFGLKQLTNQATLVRTEINGFNSVLKLLAKEPYFRDVFVEKKLEKFEDIRSSILDSIAYKLESSSTSLTFKKVARIDNTTYYSPKKISAWSAIAQATWRLANDKKNVQQLPEDCFGKYYTMKDGIFADVTDSEIIDKIDKAIQSDKIDKAKKRLEKLENE